MRDMHPAFSLSCDCIVPLYLLPITLSQTYVAEHRLCGLAYLSNDPPEALTMLSRLRSELKPP